MKSTRVLTEQPDLSVVFGSLPSERYDAVISAVERAERQLFALRDRLSEPDGKWTSPGITLYTNPSGQASIAGYIEGNSGETMGLSFSIELTPGNFYEGPPWKPGDTPRAMSHVLWEIHGKVWATPDRHGNTVVGETAFRQSTDPEEACDQLTHACLELTELAFSRPRANDAWLAEPPAS